MRKNLINRIHLAGKVYDHKLAIKTVQNTESKNYGKEFINGTLDIATDNAGLNVVTVHFTYVTETTAKGNKNATYSALKNIIESNKTVLTVGKDDAMMVKVDTALGLNDFYSNRNGEETLVSAKRNEGGFVTIVSSIEEDEDARCRFDMDMLINKVTRVEADPERNIDKDYVVVKGAVFDFRKAMLPVDFYVRSESGMKYFESLDVNPKNLVFTKVWGVEKSETIITRKEEESAFGEPSVKEYVNKRREWLITGTLKPDAVYPIGDEETGITEAEIKEAMAARERYLAEVKQKQDDYQASKNAANASSVASAPASVGGFDF